MALGGVISLIVLSALTPFVLTWLDHIDVVELTLKDGGFVNGAFWISLFSIPIWTCLVYILSLIEWRLWHTYRDKISQKKSFIPQYVLEYITSIVVIVGILAGLHVVGGWRVKPLIEAIFPVLWYGLFSVWGLPVSGLTVFVLWMLPQRREKIWRGWVSLGILTSILVSIGIGLNGEQSRLWWYLSLSEEERQERYGQEYIQPEEKVINEVIVFDPPMNAERWERYVEALEWSVFDEGLQEVEITIVNPEGQTIAVIEVENDLEVVRDKYRQSIESSGSQDEWYEDAKIDSMRIKGTQYRPVFQKIESVTGFEEVNLQ